MSRMVVLLACLPTPLTAFSVSPITSQQQQQQKQRLLTQRIKMAEKLPGFSQEVMDEAADALSSVGWAAPTSDNDAEMTSEDPFVQSIDASIQKEMGVSLDELLNPAKVGKMVILLPYCNDYIAIAAKTHCAYIYKQTHT